jgi:hypothetical protein
LSLIVTTRVENGQVVWVKTQRCRSNGPTPDCAARPEKGETKDSEMLLEGMMDGVLHGVSLLDLAMAGGRQRLLCAIAGRATAALPGMSAEQLERLREACGESLDVEKAAEMVAATFVGEWAAANGFCSFDYCDC